MKEKLCIVQNKMNERILSKILSNALRNKPFMVRVATEGIQFILFVVYPIFVM